MENVQSALLFLRVIITFGLDEMSGVIASSLLAKQVTLNFLGDTGSDNKGDIIYSAR